MTNNSASTDTVVSFKNLTEAAQLLVSETDENRIITIALMSLAHFTHSRRIELWLVARNNKSVKLKGLLTDDEVTMPDHPIIAIENPMAKVMNLRVAGIYSSENGVERYYVPMIGSKNHSKGVIVIDLPDNVNFSYNDLQTINILTDLVSVSIERLQYLHLSVYDSLTGLFVRRQFDIRILEETARVMRYGGELGIMIADIDHFKLFNDTYGHQQGDNVLQELGEILKETVRINVDIPCRYGGEELVTIMPSTGGEGAWMAAERFRQNCEQHAFSGQEDPLKVTVSIGVAAIEDGVSITPEGFIKRADIMLYKAKETGRNKVLAWRDDLEKKELEFHKEITKQI